VKFRPTFLPRRVVQLTESHLYCKNSNNRTMSYVLYDSTKSPPETGQKIHEKSTISYPENKKKKKINTRQQLREAASRPKHMVRSFGFLQESLGLAELWKDLCHSSGQLILRLLRRSPGILSEYCQY